MEVSMWHFIPMTMIHVAVGQYYVSELGSKNYNARCVASRYIFATIGQQEHDCPVALALIRASHSKDAEARYRAKAILQIRKARFDKKWVAGIKKFPWIDMLPEKYPYKHYYEYRFLEIATDEEYLSDAEEDDYEAYRFATKLFLIHQLKQGCTRSQMKIVLKKMVENEVEWCEENYYEPPP